MTDGFQVIGRGSYVTLLGPAKADLELYFERLRRWHENPILDESWWLEWNLDGESEKRTLLYPGTNINHIAGPGITPMGNHMAQMKLGIILERHPAWENVVSTQVSDAGMKVIGDALAGLLQVTNEGTLPARIESIVFENSSAAGTIDKIWAGWRPYYKGFLSFENGLDLVDGTSGTDTSNTADANAVSGSVKACSFSTSTALVERVKLRMSDVTLAGTEGWKGRYLVLLRYRGQHSSGHEYGVQLQYGWDGGSFTQNDEIFLSTSDTSYHIAELGEVEWPPGEARNMVSTDILTAAFKIYAERLSGSFGLYLDRLILIPAEHALKIEDASLDFGGNDDVIVYTFENDVMAGFARDAGTVVQSVTVDANNWYLPVGETNGGLLCVAAVRTSNISNKDDTLDVVVNYLPRWKSYRL
jgi:hypothetical protein